jgi:AbrB family looped-hinge helix DNA binding protein
MMEKQMTKNDSGEKEARGPTGIPSCCKIQSIVTVDERGQMVLPKEIRDQAEIRPGDKLAVVSMEKDGKICCIALMKIESFTDTVKGVLGPVMKDIL